jgi:nucleoid-associated protein YgaU
MDMKRTIRLIIACILVLGAALPLLGQSLLDNEYYRKAQALVIQSQKAMDDGDYDGAAALAARARESFQKSDDWVATMTQFYRANGWISVADEKVRYARSIDADRNFKDKYDSAVADVAAARTALNAKDYPVSIEHSKAAVDALAAVKPVVAKTPEPVKSDTAPLPKYYVVRLLDLRDCFWRIAGYPFVYNDPWKWKLLYNANKSVIENPDNPDLIEPGQRFVIPLLGDEVRDGDWDPQAHYPTAPTR